jgi:hypothetical protein
MARTQFIRAKFRSRHFLSVLSVPLKDPSLFKGGVGPKAPPPPFHLADFLNLDVTDTR